MISTDVETFPACEAGDESPEFSARSGRLNSRRREVRLDRTITGLVAVALLAFYLVIQRGEFVSWDGRVMAGSVYNIWEHGRLQVSPITFPDELHMTEHFSFYGSGMSFLLAPLYGLQTRLNPRGAEWLTVANPIVLAACGAVLYRTAVALQMRRSTAVGIAIVFGTLTMAPVYSTELLSEPGVTLGTVVVVLGCVRWRDARRFGPWLVGFGVAWCMIFRNDAIVLVGSALIAVPLFVPWERLRRTVRQWLPALGLPIGAALLWVAYYNNLRTGSPFVTSYGGVTFSNPLLDGLGRQLLSPGKGFFWYDPILLAALPGLVLLWRRDRPVTILILGLALIRVLLYAKWPFPDGSIAWGPRFLLPWCALLVLPLGEVWESIVRVRAPWRVGARVLIGLLVVLSALVVVASVWVSYAQYWGKILDDAKLVAPADQGAFIHQREEAAFNTVSASPLVRNLRELDESRPFPLRWFRGGPSSEGTLAVAVAVGAGSLAIGAAVVADRRRSTRPLSGTPSEAV